MPHHRQNPVQVLNHSPQLLAWQLTDELNDIKANRLVWVHDIRERLGDDWKHYWDRYQQWRCKADAIISTVKAQSVSDANWLAGKLLAHPSVYDPANFEIIIPTGVGQETFKLVGTEGQRTTAAASTSSDSNSIIPCALDEPLHRGTDRPSQRGQPGNEATQFLSRAVTTGVVSNPSLEPITLYQAMRQKRWISWTRSGFAFCLECPCCPVSVRALGLKPSKITHELIPRHFHTDPFENDHGLRHFRTAHKEDFAGGSEEMVRKYGREVIAGHEYTLCLDQWIIAANNNAVETWYSSLLSEWDKLQENYSFNRSDRRRLLRKSRASDLMTIGANLVHGKTCVFGWPEAFSAKWVILCPYPKCTLPSITKHPIHHNEAIEHFRAHGVHLRDTIEVVKLFGVKVIEDDETDVETDIRVKDSDIEGQKSPRTEYQKWSRAKLRQECNLRGLASNTRKASLQKKLILHDKLVSRRSARTKRG